MGGPLLPGEAPRPFASLSLQQLLNHLNYHERRFRDAAAEALSRLPDDDDLASAIRRAVERFEF